MSNDEKVAFEQAIIEYARKLKCPVFTPFEVIARSYGWSEANSLSGYYRPLLSILNGMEKRGILHKAILSNNVSIYWLPEREKQS